MKYDIDNIKMSETKEEVTLSTIALLQSFGNLSGQELGKVIPLLQDLATGMPTGIHTLLRLHTKTHKKLSGQHNNDK